MHGQRPTPGAARKLEEEEHVHDAALAEAGVLRIAAGNAGRRVHNLCRAVRRARRHLTDRIAPRFGNVKFT